MTRYFYNFPIDDIKFKKELPFVKVDYGVVGYHNGK